MDLEHPAISRTLKTGYPDGAGKPTNKNISNLDYIKDKEDYQMEFEDLTVRELLDMEMRIDITHFVATEEDAYSLFKKLGIDNVEQESTDLFKYLHGKHHNVHISVMYGGIF